MQNEAAEHEEKIFSSCSNPRRFDPYIPGFDLPIWVETHDDYDEKIRTELDRYVDAVSKNFGAHAHVVSETTNIVQHIKHALQCERSRDTEGAKQHIKAIIKSYSSDRFFISELDDNFAFRGNSGFKKLQRGLSAQASKPLSFFRIRNGRYEAQEALQHISRSRVSLCSSGRYNLPGLPCLYLATTSYCSWRETDKPDEFSIAGYRPTEYGKKLKILNLVNFSRLQVGIYNSHSMKDSPKELFESRVFLYPLTMAVSVAVKNPRADANFRPEYTISHLVMRCLREFGIAGVAYRSSRIDDVLGLLHTINLAIPLFDREKIFSDFLITDPGTFSPQKGLCKEKQDASSPQKHLCKEKQDAFGLSYLNKFYIKEDDVLSYISCYGRAIHYPKTSFSDIDNYLAGRTYYPMNNEK